MMRDETMLKTYGGAQPGDTHLLATVVAARHPERSSARACAHARAREK
jgi:hypothetical protein